MDNRNSIVYMNLNKRKVLKVDPILVNETLLFNYF